MNHTANFSKGFNFTGNLNHSGNLSQKYNHGNFQKECPLDKYTHAVIGYGLPTKGEYSLNRGGWKTFGTIG